MWHLLYWVAYLFFWFHAVYEYWTADDHFASSRAVTLKENCSEYIMKIYATFFGQKNSAVTDKLNWLLLKRTNWTDILFNWESDKTSTCLCVCALFGHVTVLFVSCRCLLYIACSVLSHQLARLYIGQFHVMDCSAVCTIFCCFIFICLPQIGAGYLICLSHFYWESRKRTWEKMLSVQAVVGLLCARRCILFPPSGWHCLLVHCSWYCLFVGFLYNCEYSNFYRKLCRLSAVRCWEMNV